MRRDPAEGHERFRQQAPLNVTAARRGVARPNVPGGETRMPDTPTAGPPGRIGPRIPPVEAGRDRPSTDTAETMEERQPPSPPEVRGPLERRRFPGLASQIQHARRFVARVLEPSPELTTATLLTSELATNAITHSASGMPGGKFEVSVDLAAGWARVEVRDLGSPEQPRAQNRDPYDTSEHGRGLDLVDALAATWGAERRPDGLGRLVWFELEWSEAAEGAPVPPTE
ncbi:ATP-binding protein [Streptomonospora algeriensis]|uniref:ATP-binding protein n=1 Tax=Streptomonospora algeriensis TaxID=995084 RepID=A0ABW3BL78_9ACTN